MEKEKLYTLEEATEIIETFLLNKLHKDKNIHMKIKTAPVENALAWFDPNDDGLYITDDLSRWTPELLYVLPLHENTHKVLYGLVENYENGYHNIAFRDFFEKYSGMRTYHDERLGWQFIENVGEKYIAWLEKLKEVLNEIFKVIKNTDLPKKENEQNEQADGKGGGQNGEQDGEQESETDAEKMNKILRENDENNEQSGEQNEQSGEYDNERGEQRGEQREQKGEQNDSAYQGQKQDVVLKGGKKKFRI